MVICHWKNEGNRWMTKICLIRSVKRSTSYKFIVSTIGIAFSGVDLQSAVIKVSYFLNTVEPQQLELWKEKNERGFELLVWIEFSMLITDSLLIFQHLNSTVQILPYLIRNCSSIMQKSNCCSASFSGVFYRLLDKKTLMGWYAWWVARTRIWVIG